MLLTESGDKLLVHGLVTVIGQYAEQGLPFVQGFCRLPEAPGQTITNQRLLQHLLDRSVDVHGTRGHGGGGRNVISLNKLLDCFTKTSSYFKI